MLAYEFVLLHLGEVRVCSTGDASALQRFVRLVKGPASDPVFASLDAVRTACDRPIRHWSLLQSRVNHTKPDVLKLIALKREEVRNALPRSPQVAALDDPNWKGGSERAEDKALFALIFEMPAEVLRSVVGGVVMDGGEPQRAWELRKRAPTPESETIAHVCKSAGHTATDI